MDEPEGLQEEEAARDAWNRHLYRNESVITDLFYGQYKSTVSCSQCPRVSVTFDPMMTMLLPIPPPKVTISFFYLPYVISEGYVNLSGRLTLSQNDTLADLRRAMKDKYDVDPADYTVTKVNNNEFTRFFNHKQKVEALQNETEGRFMMFYQVDTS